MFLLDSDTLYRIAPSEIGFHVVTRTFLDHLAPKSSQSILTWGPSQNTVETIWSKGNGWGGGMRNVA